MMLLDNAVSADKIGRERQGWIDAMRGFAIFLVVVGHVEMFMIRGEELSVVSRIVYLFHVPLFFFISGYLSLKEKEPEMTRGVLKRYILGNFRRLVVPPVIFFVLLNWIDPYYATLSSFDEKLYGGYLGGYWFTWVLFYVLVFLSGVKTLVRTETKLFTLIAASAVVLSFLSPYLLQRMNVGHRLFSALCLPMFFHNLQYFMLGVICKKYQSRFFQLLDRCGGAIIGMFVLSTVTLMKINMFDTPPVVRIFLSFLGTWVKYFGVLSCVVAFWAYRDYFQQRNKLSSFLVLCGKRSLDIYFIHYFLLGNMAALGSFFAGNDNTGLQILFYSVAAAAIIGLSLLFGQFLRSSGYLSYVLFGSKFPAIKR